MPDVKENAKEVDPATGTQGEEGVARGSETGAYYYDDSHGYENFDPDGDEEDSD